MTDAHTFFNFWDQYTEDLQSRGLGPKHVGYALNNGFLTREFERVDPTLSWPQVFDALVVATRVQTLNEYVSGHDKCDGSEALCVGVREGNITRMLIMAVRNVSGREVWIY